VTPETVPRMLQVLIWSGTGLTVGSFLNVAIHRLPLEHETVSRPRRSRCPSCRRTLTWRENVPVLSWVLQRGRCRGCGWRIPVRYPLVELLTACLWGLAAWRLPVDQWDLLIVHLLVLSGLVVSTFVDFAHFEIPDQVSIGGIVLAPFASILVPGLHDHTWIAQWATTGWEPGVPVDRLAALIGSLVGIAVGWSLLWGIGRVGSWLYGREAMGRGDMKLLAAAGGFLGPGGAVLAFMLGALAASVAGAGAMLRYFLLSRARARRRGNRRSVSMSIRVAREAGRYIPFGPYLGIGIGIALLAWNDVLQFLQ